MNISSARKTPKTIIHLLRVAFLAILTLLATTCATELYPDIGKTAKQRNYGFTKISEERRERNELSGLNLCGILNTMQWKLVVAEEYYFDLIKEAGFRYIRVPVLLMPLLKNESGVYSLDEAPMARLDTMLGYILDRDMIAILDFQDLLEDESMRFATKEGAAQMEEVFLAIWKLLSARYGDYPPNLYFELLNEPHEPIDMKTWNRYVKKSLGIIRASGRSNAKRMVVVSSALWNGIDTVGELELPSVDADPNIVVAFHLYDPIELTFQGMDFSGYVAKNAGSWIGNSWDNTEAQRAYIIKRFNAMAAWATKSSRAIMLGEFGVSTYADADSQVNWTRLVREEAERRLIPWQLWQFYDVMGVGGIYNADGCYWRKELFDALMANAAPREAGPRRPEVEARVRALIAKLSDKEWKERERAAIALRTTDPEADLAVSALTASLSDENWKVRMASALALSAIGAPTLPALGALETALRDSEWWVRRAAAQAISSLGPTAISAKGALISALSDEEWFVRKTVVIALSRVAPDDPEVIEAIRARLEDSEYQVRYLADLFIKALADEER